MNLLAINGGAPVRDTPLYYGKQCIDEDDILAVGETLRSPFITTGPKVEELENKLCSITTSNYAVMVSNGTAALHLACLALGLKKGDEVITTPMTFAASANCILYCGATPVFADIDPDTYNISIDEIKRCITKNTKAIIVVDFTGQTAELDEIIDICNKYNITLIEDAAHSIGSKYKNRSVGTIADMTTFSFHPVKTVTAGEGGAILTNSKKYYDKLMLYRTHGITKDSRKMINMTSSKWYYEQQELGYNYRITDFQAALLISQLNKLKIFATRRKEIVEMYNSAFKNINEIALQKPNENCVAVKHLYIIKLNLAKLKVGRQEIFDALWAENICCNVHYIPVYLHPYYKRIGFKEGLCPNAEKLYEQIISIPIYYSLSDNDVNDVILAIKKVLLYYKK